MVDANFRARRRRAPEPVGDAYVLRLRGRKPAGVRAADDLGRRPRAIHTLNQGDLDVDPGEVGLRHLYEGNERVLPATARPDQPAVGSQLGSDRLPKPKRERAMVKAGGDRRH
jgi:hypothetical protein